MADTTDKRAMLVEDDEIQVLAKVGKLLGGLPVEARTRVMAYLVDKYEPEIEVTPKAGKE